MRRSLALLVLLALPLAGIADVDLTPRRKTISIGSHEIQRVHFVDGDKEIAITMDQQTDVTPEGQGALFRFKNVSQSSAQLKASPIKATHGFSPEALPAYAKAAQGMIDATAQEVTADPVALNVVPVNDWQSCRHGYSYSIAGVKIRQTYTFLNLSEKQQVLFVVTALDKDFAEISERADKLLKRWHAVQPGDELGYN